MEAKAIPEGYQNITPVLVVKDGLRQLNIIKKYLEQ